MNLHSLNSNNTIIRDQVLEALNAQHNWGFTVDPDDENHITTRTEGYCWRWWLKWLHSLYPRRVESLYLLTDDIDECLSPGKCREDFGEHRI